MLSELIWYLPLKSKTKIAACHILWLKSSSINDIVMFPNSRFQTHNYLSFITRTRTVDSTFHCNIFAQPNDFAKWGSHNLSRTRSCSPTPPIIRLFQLSVRIFIFKRDTLTGAMLISSLDRGHPQGLFTICLCLSDRFSYSRNIHPCYPY